MPRIDRRAANSRESILDAAQRVVARDGAAHLTIDAVARECGLSKGGVLYNFCTKDALLDGMLQRLSRTFSDRIDAFRHDLRDAPNPTLRALIKVMEFKDSMDDKVPLTLLAASAQSPGLLDPIRLTFRERRAQIVAECSDPVAALIIAAAVDGLMFQTLFKMTPAGGQDRAAVIARLDEMAKTLV